MSHSTPRKTRRPDEALVSYPALRPEGCLTCIRDDMTSPARMNLHYKYFGHLFWLLHSFFTVDRKDDIMTEPVRETMTVVVATNTGTATNCSETMHSRLDQ